MSRFDEITVLATQSLPEEKELTLSSVLRDELPSSLRKRHVWHGGSGTDDDADSYHSDDSDLLDDDDDDEDDLEEEDDAVGCPLPSTPEDNQLLEEEVSGEQIPLTPINPSPPLPDH